jgi:predicted NUDIX family phosphoesterase
MSAVGLEQVMVVPTELFRQCGYFQGFCDQPENYLHVLLDTQNTLYLPRDQMENDPSFKQLIPYCIFQYVDDRGIRHVFQYRRGTGQGETRLHKKRSVGIGGHISTLDTGDHSSYLVGLQRELDEEILIDSPHHQRLVGLINDDESEVGKVHLGIVHLFTIEEPKIWPREPEIIEAGFCPVQELLDRSGEFETWSQISLKALF